MAVAASTPEMRSLFATIDATTSLAKKIGAIVVVVSMTITVTTTAAPPYRVSKRNRSDCLDSNEYCPRNKQPREQKSLAGR